MIAPLTWSGVQPGLRARICAAMPETIGAANDVPESFRYPGATIRSGRSMPIVAPTGAWPTMYRPAATTSGLAKPSLV
jgi:hypothetical protein